MHDLGGCAGPCREPPCLGSTMIGAPKDPRVRRLRQRDRRRPPKSLVKWLRWSARRSAPSVGLVRVSPLRHRTNVRYSDRTPATVSMKIKLTGSGADQFSSSSLTSALPEGISNPRQDRGPRVPVTITLEPDDPPFGSARPGCDRLCMFVASTTEGLACGDERWCGVERRRGWTTA